MTNERNMQDKSQGDWFLDVSPRLRAAATEILDRPMTTEEKVKHDSVVQNILEQGLFHKTKNMTPLYALNGGPRTTLDFLMNYRLPVADIDWVISYMIDHLVKESENNPAYPFITSQLKTAWNSYKEYIVNHLEDFQMNHYTLDVGTAIMATLLEMVKFPRYGNQPFNVMKDNGMYNLTLDQTLDSMVTSAQLHALHEHEKKGE